MPHAYIKDFVFGFSIFLKLNGCMISTNNNKSYRAIKNNGNKEICDSGYGCEKDGRL